MASSNNNMMAIAKDYLDLKKNIESYSDGQATVSHWDDTNLTKCEVTISPKDGPYMEGAFVFEIKYDREKGGKIPLARCKTDIYHPNIERNGEVCLILFRPSDAKTAKCPPRIILQALLYLLYEPNLEEPLCTAFPWTELTKEEFERNVNLSIAGGTIADRKNNNVQFPVNARYASLHPSEEEGEEV